MSELKFIETTDETIYTDILEELENGVGEPLYPGDERRIFGDTMAKVIVTVYNTVNDACRQKMLRYARGTVLDALGENRDVIRLDPTYATTTLRFTVTEAVGSNIIIPAGLRVTGDFVHYFLTDTTAVLYAGSLYVDVAATAEEGGTDYNNIDEGEISEIVDVSDVPLLDGVTNLTITEGGGDRESGNAVSPDKREDTSACLRSLGAGVPPAGRRIRPHGARRPPVPRQCIPPGSSRVCSRWGSGSNPERECARCPAEEACRVPNKGPGLLRRGLPGFLRGRRRSGT